MIIARGGHSCPTCAGQTERLPTPCLLGSRQWLSHDIPIASAVGWGGHRFAPSDDGPLGGGNSRTWQSSAKAGQADCAQGFCGHAGAPAGVVEGRAPAGQRLTEKGSIVGTNYQLPAVGRVLCDTGRCTYGILPRERSTLHGLPQDHGLCKPEL